MSRWPEVTLRKVADLGTGHTPSRQVAEYWTDCTIPWLTLADVGPLRAGTTSVVVDTKEKISPLGLANSAAVLHPAGTVVMSRTASVGFSAILGTDMATSQDYVAWRCGLQLEPRFLLHALRGLRDRILAMRMGSTHQTIYMPDVERIRIPLPPIEEQRRIADHLDGETARIDALIAKRQRQIDLVEERFTASVFGHITGRHVKARRRSVRVEWIGSVPVGWGVAWLGANYETQLGKMLNSEASAGPDQRPYLRNVNVQWDSIDLSDVGQMSFDQAERARFRLRPGDLLVCEGGDVGRAALWTDAGAEMYFQKALHRVRPLGDAVPRFLLYCLRAASARGAFRADGNQSTIVHLTGEQLRAHRFPHPPSEEQQVVVNRLDEQRQSTERTKGLLNRQIELLRERRQALITALVTGEVTVP